MRWNNNGLENAFYITGIILLGLGVIFLGWLLYFTWDYVINNYNVTVDGFWMRFPVGIGITAIIGFIILWSICTIDEL